jgi:hypothetical protein
MINQGIYVVGLRESMDAELGELVTKLNTAALREYRRILQDELKEYHLDLLNDLTLIRSDQEAAYFRIHWLVNQHRFEEAKALSASISAVLPALKSEKVDYDRFEYLLDMFEDFAYNPRTLSATEQNNLESWVDPSRPSTTRLVIDLLAQHGLFMYNEPMVYPDQHGLTRNSISPKTTTADLYTIFPNPANDFIQVRTTNQRSLQDHKLLITEITGRIVFNGNPISDSSGETLIDLSSLPSGTYNLNIFLHDQIIESKQFFKE